LWWVVEAEFDLGDAEKDQGAPGLRPGMTPRPARKEERFGNAARGEFLAGECEGGEQRVGARGMATEKRAGETIGTRQRSVGQGSGHGRVAHRGLLAFRRPVSDVPTFAGDQGESDEESDEDAPCVAPPPADDAFELLLVKLVVEMFAHSGTPEPAARGKMRLLRIAARSAWIRAGDGQRGHGHDEALACGSRRRARRRPRTSVTKHAHVPGPAQDDAVAAGMEKTEMMGRRGEPPEERRPGGEIAHRDPARPADDEDEERTRRGEKGFRFGKMRDERRGRGRASHRGRPGRKKRR
jgi:hypothetical protein